MTCNKCDGNGLTGEWMSTPDQNGWFSVRFKTCDCKNEHDQAVKQLLEENAKLSERVQHWRSEAMNMYRLLESLKERIETCEPFAPDVPERCGDCEQHHNFLGTHKCVHGGMMQLTDHEVNTKRSPLCPLAKGA